MLFFAKRHQKWLENSIPNKKTDNSDLIRDVLYKIVIHFVEDEDGLNAMPWNEDELHKEVLQEVEQIYNWIKEDRPLILNKLRQMWDNCNPLMDASYAEVQINDINEVEEYILKMDEKHLSKIVQYRTFLNII